MKARVHVMLKAGVLDPQGEAVRHALGAMGFDGVEFRCDSNQKHGVELGQSPDVDIGREAAQEMNPLVGRPVVRSQIGRRPTGEPSGTSGCGEVR